MSVRPGATGRVATRPRAARSDAPADRHELLEVADRDALGDDPGGQLVLAIRIVDPEQRAGVPGRQDTGRDSPLHRRRELEQPQRVGDLRSRAADPLSELVVRAAEVVEQLLVGGGLFERIELGPVQVLQQRVAQQGVVGGLADDGRDGVEAGASRRRASAARP